MCCVWLCVLRVCMCVALSLELYNGYAKWFSLTAGAIFLLFLLLPAAATFSSRPFQWFPPPDPSGPVRLFGESATLRRTFVR